MSTKHNRPALTITELAVVGIMLVVLTAVVLPGVAAVSRRDAGATCLSNLGQLGQASLMYATDDLRSLIVPMHRMDVSSDHGKGFTGGPWGWRTAQPIAFGGRTPITRMPTAGGDVTVLMEAELWGTPTRPLNPYVAGNRSRGSDWLEVFHCPADSGYSESVYAWPDPLDGPAPPEAAGIPCFDFLGNSYRANTCGVFWSAGFYTALGSLAVSPKGHTPAQILNPARVVLYSDPLFYATTRLAASGIEFEPFQGWHGEMMADNVVYCDGSARLTALGELYEFDEEELADMDYCQDFDPSWFLRRGPTWQMDCYPAPGALTKTYSFSTHRSIFSMGHISDRTGWPFTGFTQNESPF
jgi:hypothetical protein